MDAGQGGKLAFDLSQLDTKTADLDLIVNAPVKENFAVMTQAHRIARAIEDRVAAIAGKGIGDEFFCRQFRPHDIAKGNAWSADQQFTLRSRRHRLQIFADHIGGIIGNWCAYGDRCALFNDVNGGNDGRLGRTIGIENCTPGFAPALRQCRRAGFPTQNDDAQ